MDIESIMNYFTSLPHTTESLPFDDSTLVYKVGDKMFGLISIKPPFSMNVKCDPERAISLREQYHFVNPGYHMNKKH